MFRNGTSRLGATRTFWRHIPVPRQPLTTSCRWHGDKSFFGVTSNLFLPYHALQTENIRLDLYGYRKTARVPVSASGQEHTLQRSRSGSESAIVLSARHASSWEN